MEKKKIIHWCHEIELNKKGEMMAAVHLLVGYNHGTVLDFLQMADEIRQTFPQATNDEICCAKVTHSDSVLGYSLASWNTYLPEGDYPGWTQFKPSKIDYSW
jgi:hypothetical protein